MTYLQAIREDLQPFPVSANLITRGCEKHGLTAGETATDENTILIIEVEILTQIVALQSVSEGDISKSFDIEAATKLICRKCEEAGLDASKYVKIDRVTLCDDEDWS